MATWKPRSDEPVGNNEHVGRRLFDEPMLAGATDQKAFGGLILRNFEENRDREFSLDRLGRTGVDRKVVSYLLPRANAAATRFVPHRSFDGWAVLRARVLENPPKGLGLPVTASPIAGDGVDENIYHAHATLPESQDAHQRYSSALHLRHLFASHGTVHRVHTPTQSTQPPGGFGVLMDRILTSLRSVFSRD